MRTLQLTWVPFGGGGGSLVDGVIQRGAWMLCAVGTFQEVSPTYPCQQRSGQRIRPETE
jgi:hypothetical protein